MLRVRVRPFLISRLYLLCLFFFLMSFRQFLGAFWAYCIVL